mgnify:CR=1 FL=1
MAIKRVIGASVAQPNTKESDIQDEVRHVVEVIMEDGEPSEIFITASCPMDAIEKANRLIPEEPPTPAMARFYKEVRELGWIL